VTLPASDTLVAVLRAAGVLAPSAPATVEIGTYAATVTDDGLTWVVREVPTEASEDAGVAILTVALDVDDGGVGLGIAVDAAGQGWRLDREDQTKVMLDTLARFRVPDAMATVLALFQSGGPPERAIVDPPDIVDTLGLAPELLEQVHGPRLDTAEDGSWRLEFWSVGTELGELGPRSTLYRWTATSQDGDVAWWGTPVWTSDDPMHT
jgi:hypothetical protein